MGRIFLSVVYSVAAAVALYSMVGVTTVYEHILDDLNELRTEGCGSGTLGMVSAELDGKITVIQNYMNGLNKRRGPGVQILGVVMNTKELGGYAAKFWAAITLAVPILLEYSAVFEGLLEIPLEVSRRLLWRALQTLCSLIVLRLSLDFP